MGFTRVEILRALILIRARSKVQKRAFGIFTDRTAFSFFAR